MFLYTKYSDGNGQWSKIAEPGLNRIDSKDVARNYIVSYETVYIFKENIADEWIPFSTLFTRKMNEITKGPIVQFSREQTRFPKAQQENQKLGHHNITTKTQSYVNQEKTRRTESNHTYQTVISTKGGQREWLSSQYFLI